MNIVVAPSWAMPSRLDELIAMQCARAGDAIALVDRARNLSYTQLAEEVERVARALVGLEVERGARIAVFLDKRLETVISFFAASRAGCVFVPINPLLKPAQVAHILNDCGVTVLVTLGERLRLLEETLGECPTLQHVILVDGDRPTSFPSVHDWGDLEGDPARGFHRVIDRDLAAIFYTSGSTGKPKGVMLSHRNLVAGAHSVAQYLENCPDDRLLAVLPLSFDAGFSQITTAFASGARAVLLNYLVPADVIRAVVAERITGLTAVPPLWIQLAGASWPTSVHAHLRYLANTGGRMPKATVAQLQASLPSARIFLMYGLTEAFRSTYLPPEELARHPDSIGRAIPNAEILVLREDGTPCADDEPGELVHRGCLVAMGYWNDPIKTAERFRALPDNAGVRAGGETLPEIAVFSGDTVRRDANGLLYFIGRKDEMIKSSGYRISPSEVEEVFYLEPSVGEVVVFGCDHPVLGQALVALIVPRAGTCDLDALRSFVQQRLPRYMVPHHLELAEQSLLRGVNGKIDRKAIAARYADLFTPALAVAEAPR